MYSTTNNEKKDSKKIKKGRCHQCNKRLSLIYFTCKCNNKYCIKHQLPHNHNCTYNYKPALTDKIIKNNPRIKQKSIEIL